MRASPGFELLGLGIMSIPAKDRVVYVCDKQDSFRVEVEEDSRSYEVRAWSLLLGEALDYVLHTFMVKGFRR